MAVCRLRTSFKASKMRMMSMPVLAHAADEGLHHVVGEAGVLDDVLAAQQHELRRLGRGLLQRAQAVEGIFVEEAQAGINGRAAPGFQAVEAHAVENGRGGQHLGGGHARGGHGLMAVPQHRVIEEDRFHCLYYSRMELVATVN